MAVVTIKSTAVTNADTTTQTLNKAILAGGRVRQSIGTIETGADDDIASIYRFCRVHSSWRISRVDLYCDAVTSGAANFGIHDIASVNSGAAVDADFFGSAVSIATAITVGTNITHEGGAYGVEDIEKPLWEALGLSSDPGKWYDLTCALTAATTAAGTVSVVVTFQAGD